MSWFMPCKNTQSANPIKLAVSWLIVISRTLFYKINGETIYTIALTRRMMILCPFVLSDACACPMPV